MIYVNTSEEDLNTLDSSKFKYHINGGEGCNHDRHKAKQLVIDDYDNIAQEIDNKLNTDFIFCIFSSSGGTGSGAGPMLLDLLIDDEKTVGAITIIPSIDESIKSQINSYECFTELKSIEGTSSIFILDNGKESDRLSINQKFVDAFVDFIEIPDKHKSVKGNIDRAEIQESLKAHGMAIVTVTSGTESAAVIDTFSDNVFAPLENDRTIKYITASSSFDLSMNDLVKSVGIAVDYFQTYNEDHTICLLSGLKLPFGRLDQVLQMVESNKETIIKNLSATKDYDMKSDFNFLSGQQINKSDSAPDNKHKTKRDIMKKYFK